VHVSHVIKGNQAKANLILSHLLCDNFFDYTWRKHLRTFDNTAYTKTNTIIKLDS